MTQSQFPLCSYFRKATYNQQTYLQRTCRNHYWVGGPDGQNEIRKLRIGVAGLGGMGSQVAELLARIGVGHLRIADPDTIDATNLNRQVIANSNTVGAKKAEAAQSELSALAEDFELVVYSHGITKENVSEFVRGCDAIVDEIDVFKLKEHVYLHDAANELGIPIYSAYVVGMGTHFYKFQGSNYTFRDFLKVETGEWLNPTADFLFEVFAHPLPEHLDAAAISGYKKEVAEGRVPIFGTSTLLGQSLVVIRMITDLLVTNSKAVANLLTAAQSTPVMPDFLVLDPMDIQFKKARTPRTKEATKGKDRSQTARSGQHSTP